MNEIQSETAEKEKKKKKGNSSSDKNFDFHVVMNAN